MMPYTMNIILSFVSTNEVEPIHIMFILMDKLLIVGGPRGGGGEV